MSECVSVENVKRITPNEGTVERADEKLRPGKSTQPYLKRQGKTERERERGRRYFAANAAIIPTFQHRVSKSIVSAEGTTDSFAAPGDNVTPETCVQP